MCGKMQESELTEIIPLICSSAIWGQYPVFSYPEFPQGSLAHVGHLHSLEAVIAFIDMAENSSFLTVISQELKQGLKS